MLRSISAASRIIKSRHMMFGLCLMLSLATSPFTAMASFSIPWQIAGQGGMIGSSTNYELRDTSGQIGMIAEESTLRAGYFFVTTVNHAPIINVIAEHQVYENEMLMFSVTANDIDLDSLVITFSPLPQGATFTASGTFTWTPASEQAGTYAVTFIVHDTQNAVDTKTIIITVKDIANAAQHLSDSLVVYPNPFKSDRHTHITFGKSNEPEKALTSQANIKIYSLAGELIREIEETDGDGQAVWDVTNNHQRKVGSGVYIYFITNNQGGSCKGKVVVIE